MSNPEHFDIGSLSAVSYRSGEEEADPQGKACEVPPKVDWTLSM